LNDRPTEKEKRARSVLWSRVQSTMDEDLKNSCGVMWRTFASEGTEPCGRKAMTRFVLAKILNLERGTQRVDNRANYPFGVRDDIPKVPLDRRSTESRKEDELQGENKQVSMIRVFQEGEGGGVSRHKDRGLPSSGAYVRVELAGTRGSVSASRTIYPESEAVPPERKKGKNHERRSMQPREQVEFKRKGKWTLPWAT